MQVRAARTRQALILAAARLIDERGMKGTGLLDISRAAGVSKGALYFHFASKDELVAAVRREARESVLALAGECLDGGNSTLAGAARFTVAMSRHMREDPVLRAGLRLESECPGTQGAGGSLREGWLMVLRERLAADAVAGKLDGGADAAATANLVAAVTVGLEALGREDESWWGPEITAGIWQLLLRLAGADDESASQVSCALGALRPEPGQVGAVSPAPAPGAADSPSPVSPAAARHTEIRQTGRSGVPAQPGSGETNVVRLPSRPQVSERPAAMVSGSAYERR